MNKSSNREGRIDEQIAFIESKNVDILLLQEVRHGRDRRWTEYWREQLAEIGLGNIEDSLDWAAELATSSVPPHDDIGHDNGHITAVSQTRNLQPKDQLIRERLKSSDLSNFSTNFPEKILVSELETPDGTIELWNVRSVPGNSWGEEKIKIFETVYNRLTDTDIRPRILAGDFNTPDKELADGQAVPFGYNKDREVRQRYINAELNILKGLGYLGMVDVFRAHHGYGELEIDDTSWKNKRFDHIFASESFGVNRCYYDHDGKEYSDHAPIIADFESNRWS